ncbi:MAG: hypothetical protein LAT76_04710 [Schleiferiaceae bacterium]|nr:hypothetical protein [Schleiferiaceae bacterium]
MEPIFIIGAGGLGREVLALIRSQSHGMEIGEPTAFIDDAVPVGTEVDGLEVVGGLEVLAQYEGASLIIAVGKGDTRKAIVDKLDTSRFDFPNVIHTSVIFDAPHRTTLGKGNIIMAGNILTTNITVGDFCLFNLGCTIGHDAVFGNFCTLMHQVKVSGGANMGNTCFVGTGAALIKANTIGDNVTIAAGRVVDFDIESNTNLQD